MPKQTAYKNKSLKKKKRIYTAYRRLHRGQSIDGHPRSSQGQPGSEGVAWQLHSSHSWGNGTAEGGTCASCSLISFRQREGGEGARPTAGEALHSSVWQATFDKPFIQEQLPSMLRPLLTSHWDKTQVWPETSPSGAA